MARIAIDVNNVGVAGSFVFAGSKYAEHADAIVLHHVERTPFTRTLLTRSREERHLVF